MDYALTFLIGFWAYNLSTISERKNYLSGPIGPQGFQGHEGPSGSLGPVGPKGSKGQRGPTGPVGPSGLSGSTGPTGSQKKGFKGPTGPEMGLGVYITSMNKSFLFSDSDGINWTTVPVIYQNATGPASINLFMDTCFWNGIYAAVGSTSLPNSNGIYLSLDCINWFLQEESSGIGFGYSGIYNGQAITVNPNSGVFAAVGLGPGKTFRSHGQLNRETMQLGWTQITNSYELTTVRYFDVADGNFFSGFYAAGNSDVVYFTDDSGITSLKHFTDGTGGIFDLVYSKELDLLIITSWAVSNTITTLYWTSNPATTWTAGTGVLFKNIGQSLKWNGKIFIACGAVEAGTQDGFGDGPTIIWSEDGKVWQNTINSSSSGVNIFKQFAMTAKWTGSRWIAVGSNAGYNTSQPISTHPAWSYDGKTWYESLGDTYSVPSLNIIQANAIVTFRNDSIRSPDVIAYAKIKKN